jgi:tripartite-type tricarboxylate transporter receptor subunit TctC
MMWPVPTAVSHLSALPFSARRSLAAKKEDAMRPSNLARMLLLAVCVSMLFGSPAIAAAAGPSFPEKGKPIAFIVPYAPGGGNDVAARLLTPLLEKELGTPVQVMNRPGAGGQVGTTAIATAKADGYTVGYIIFAPAITSYLDPDRKAVYSRNSFQTLGGHFMFPVVMSVSATSPYNSVQELVQAAAAKPYSIKAGATGILGTTHLASLQLQRAAGIKFASVQFDGGAPAITALLGGHVDVVFNGLSEVVSQAKAGQIKVLGTFGKQASPLLPGTRTMEAQGYKVYMGGASGVCAPAGVSKEVVKAYSEAIRKAVTDKQHENKLIELGYIPSNLGPEEYASFWAEYESDVKPLMEMGKAEIAK